MYSIQYLDLVSNVKTSEKDEHNTIGSFITPLAHPLYLEGTDEIGLHEYQFTKSWFNVKEEGYVTFRTSNGSQLSTYSTTGIIPVVIPIAIGYYDIKTLTAYISQTIGGMMVEQITRLSRNTKIVFAPYAGFTGGIIPLPVQPRAGPASVQTEDDSWKRLRYKVHEVSKLPEISYYQTSHTVGITPGIIKLIPEDNATEKENHFIFFDFSDNINEILGTENCVDYTWVTINGKPKEGPIQGRAIEDPRSKLFVYCDIIQHHRVGDTQAKVLKIIPVPPNLTFGEDIHREVQDIQFYPPSQKEVREVEIEIRDDTGEPVKFNFGRVVLTLAIKSKINNGFLF